ncbi:MAG TPA: beta-eliminating lyase-related protein [Streptosporangiaceae bacterium]
MTHPPAASRKSFGSDNHSAAHPAVLRAIAEAGAAGHAAAYGADPWTAAATRQLCELTGAAAAYFVFTGTAANTLGLSLLLRPYEGVICAESSHLNWDECGAPERIVGTKLLTAAAPDGKLTPELIASRLSGRGDEHRIQPRVVEIAQVTELGTCYTLDELKGLREFCTGEGLLVYLDGARLANAAAYLDCEPADIAACADVLSFGGTKNGAAGAEAVLVMRRELAADAPFLRKQQLQLASKMRFLAVQFSALLADSLWLRNARAANAMAQRLGDGVSALDGVGLRQPVQSNAIFASLQAERISRLQHEWAFELWDERERLVRWMTSFDTTESDVDGFVAAVEATAVAVRST